MIQETYNLQEDGLLSSDSKSRMVKQKRYFVCINDMLAIWLSS